MNESSNTILWNKKAIFEHELYNIISQTKNQAEVYPVKTYLEKRLKEINTILE